MGSTRESQTAAGNTTTRLLGTFQKVDYVFILGVAGGVPHYTDYKRHVRLGDVVVSTAAAPTTTATAGDKPFVYAYSSGDDRRTYHPVNACLQDIARGLNAIADDADDSSAAGRRPWETYLADGLAHLLARTENDFRRPAANSDKLYMNIGNRDVIEVAHPLPQQPHAGDGAANRIHLGPIGSSKDLGRSDQARTEFVQRYGLVATDLEMSSVLDSIIGNCRDSFIVVKGERATNAITHICIV